MSLIDAAMWNPDPVSSGSWMSSATAPAAPAALPQGATFFQAPPAGTTSWVPTETGGHYQLNPTAADDLKAMNTEETERQIPKCKTCADARDKKRQKKKGWGEWAGDVWEGAKDGATGGGLAGTAAGCAVGTYVGAAGGLAASPYTGGLSIPAGGPAGCVAGGGIGGVGGTLLGGAGGAAWSGWQNWSAPAAK